MLAKFFHAGYLYFGVSAFFVIATLIVMKWIYDIREEVIELRELKIDEFRRNNE